MRRARAVYPDEDSEDMAEADLRSCMDDYDPDSKKDPGGASCASGKPKELASLDRAVKRWHVENACGSLDWATPGGQTRLARDRGC